MSSHSPVGIPSWPAAIVGIVLLSCLPAGAALYDFGNVVRGLDYTNVFVLSNMTSGAWTIARIRPLCDCVKATRYDARVPAGSTGDVALVLETAKLHGKVRYLTMVDISGSQPIQLEIRASVLDDLAVAPAAIDLGNVRMGTKLDPPAVCVFSRTGRKLPAPMPLSKPAWLNVDTIPVDQNCQTTAATLCTGWFMRFSCAAPPAGLVDTQFQFTFACTNSGRYAIRVTGRIEPLFAAQPALLTLGRIATSTVVEKTVAIVPLVGDKVKVVGVSASSPAVSVISMATNDPRHAQVTLRIQPAKRGMLDETLTVLVDNQAQKEVPIRILGNAQ